MLGSPYVFILVSYSDEKFGRTVLHIINMPFYSKRTQSVWTVGRAFTRSSACRRVGLRGQSIATALVLRRQILNGAIRGQTLSEAGGADLVEARGEGDNVERTFGKTRGIRCVLENKQE